MPNPSCLYVGLCDYLRACRPQWPGTGHEWTSPIKSYFICSAPLLGLRAWLEVPMNTGKSQPKLALVVAPGFPATAQDRATITIESEAPTWNSSIEAWGQAVEPKLGKLLDANCCIGVLVTQRSGDVEAAFDALHGLVRARAPLSKELLLVVLAPPDNETERGCTAHGIIYQDGAEPQRLEPAVC